MNTYADDLATLMEHLDLKDAILLGFSTGGGEVARYIGRHGTRRVAKAGLISAIPPWMLKTTANPGGLPIEVFDRLRNLLWRIVPSYIKTSQVDRSSATTGQGQNPHRAQSIRSGFRG